VVSVREKEKGSGIWWIFVCHKGKRTARKIGKKPLAEEAARIIGEGLEKGEMIPDFQDIPLFKDYIRGWTDAEGKKHEGWMNDAGMMLKESTRESYRLIAEARLVPAFGNVRTDEITPRMIHNFMLSLFKEGLRSPTVRNIRNCLSAVFRDAFQEGCTESNPVKGIRISAPADEVPSREPDPFSYTERNYFEDVIREHFPVYYAFVVCGFRTGLRIGEIIALQWDDLDFKERLITVRRNITRGKITVPKSRAGKRQVRMTAFLCEVLEKQERSSVWVFPNKKGSFVSYSNFIQRVWNRAMKMSALRRRTPHDMRHTYATMRLAKGDPPAEVAKEMGHSRQELTYRIYYKWIPKDSLSCIDDLD
jgi:integrase